MLVFQAVYLGREVVTLPRDHICERTSAGTQVSPASVWSRDTPELFQRSVYLGSVDVWVELKVTTVNT